MEDAMFTPGPWNTVMPVVHGPDGEVVAVIKCLEPIKERHELLQANGHLIAAAPDLYDALWQILDDMGRDGTCCCSAAKEQAIVAMAKARGEIINPST